MTISHTIRQAAPGLQTVPALARLLTRTRRAAAAAVHRMQYGQMVAVLHRLSDEQLEAIGVARRDIRAHAHRLIYGPG